MKDLPRRLSFDIYAAKYWDAVSEEVVDNSVNMGSNRAGKFLQRPLNVLNKQGGLSQNPIQNLKD